jgi:hypothetical protein
MGVEKLASLNATEKNFFFAIETNRTGFFISIYETENL